MGDSAIRTGKRPVDAPRRITQISASDTHVLFAVCDDGTVWKLRGSIWEQLPSIPQPQ